MNPESAVILIEKANARAENAEAEVARLHSWDGLMELLDERWPEDIFPTMEDSAKRDLGPRIVSLVRWVARLRAQVEQVEAIHAPVRVYDECEHDSDHGCEPVELYDYRGCSESAIGWGCSVCCYDDEHPRESCPHGADHHGVTKADACPTVAALRGDDR